MVIVVGTIFVLMAAGVGVLVGYLLKEDFKKSFIKKATRQGCVTEAVCFYASKSLWSEMFWDCPWIKSYKIITMYSYHVDGKSYSKTLKFRVSKKPDTPRNPYIIRIYYAKNKPSRCCFEPTNIY